MANLRINIPDYVLKWDRKVTRDALREAGREIAASARKLIASSGGGRTYGSHTASAPGEAPATDTGQLAKRMSVKLGRGGTSVTITDSVFYALILEAGAAGGGGRKGGRNRRGKPATVRIMAPRPYLSTALDADGDAILARLSKVITSGFGLAPR